MVFSITLVLAGDVEIELLRRAWFATVQQHPRMCARLVSHGRRQRWQLQQHVSEASFVYRSLASDAIADVDDAESVRPRLGVGMKCVIQSADQRHWSIRLLFHHACCDGVGAIRMIGQFVKAYANPNPRSPNSEIEAEVIVDRRLRPSGVADIIDRRLRPSESIGTATTQPSDQLPTPAKSASAPLPDLNNLWTTIRGSNVRLTQRVAAGDAACPAPSGTTTSTFQNASRLMFSRAQSDQIRELLRSRKLTLNDWALTITLHTLANVTAAAASKRRHVMIMNPVEMRTWAQRYDANNHIGIAFVRRTHRELADLQQTLDSVSEQMQNVRRYGTAHELASGIAYAERIPGCLGLLERLGTFTPTAALTSVAGLRMGKRFGVRRQNGRLWIADAELTDVFFEGAIQNGGQVSTTIWEFEGQIAIAHRTAAGLFNRSENQQLLALWAHIATQQLGTNDSTPVQRGMDS